MTVKDNEGAKNGAPVRELYLVEEITHRVLNDYSELIAALKLASMSECGSAHPALKSTVARLQMRAQAYRALQAPTTSARMELGGYLEHVCAAISAARLAERGASLTLAADQVWLDADRCWLVGLVIAELINNAARHGLSGGPGAIRVDMVSRGSRTICAVANCGRVSDGSGRGRRLVEALSAELGGTVEWRFVERGCCVWLEFPIERPARTLPIWAPISPR